MNDILTEKLLKLKNELVVAFDEIPYVGNANDLQAIMEACRALTRIVDRAAFLETARLISNA